MTAILETRDLTFGYAATGVTGARGSSTKALDGVSVAVEPGRVLGIVGESGSGKSTLLRTIVGLNPGYSGRVLYRGEPVDHRSGRAALAAFRGGVQMVFQDPGGSLNPFRTIRHSLAAALERAGADAGPSALAGLLANVGMDESALNRRPNEFSGGQLQRLAIARALASDPAVLLCDEPTSALDVSIQAQILDLFLRLRAEGRAFVFVTHNLGVLGHVADTIAVMYRGRVVETAPARELIRHPREAYTTALVAASPRLSDRGALLRSARARLRGAGVCGSQPGDDS